MKIESARTFPAWLFVCQEEFQGVWKGNPDFADGRKIEQGPWGEALRCAQRWPQVGLSSGMISWNDIFQASDEKALYAGKDICCP